MNKETAIRWAARLNVVRKMFVFAAVALLAISFVAISPDEAQRGVHFQTFTYWVGLCVAGFCFCALVAPMLRAWASGQE